MNSRFLLMTLLALSPLARAETTVDGPLTQSFTFQPGQPIRAQLTLRNTGDRDELVRLSLSDLAVEAQGSRFLAVGSLPRSSSLWVKLPFDAVTVPAGGTRTVDFRLEPPQGTPQGTFWSALLVQPEGDPSAAPLGPGLRQKVQYAVQLVASAGGKPQVSFEKPQLSRDAQGVRFSVQTRNDGDAWSVPGVRLEVYDAQGRRVLEQANPKKRLYPGGGQLETFALGALPAGRYQLVVLADDGSSELVGSKYSVTVRD